MDFNNIKDIISIFDSSSIDKLKLENGDFKISLERNNTVYIESSEKPVVSKTETVIEAPTVKEPIKENIEDSNYTFVSPLVGTFYAAPSPESQPYVKVGDEVKVDDVICIVEAMKMINEIKSPVNGKIVEILVNNEDLVEFEQPIFKIEVI
ncbi:acetyl-CoA carboxylase biotin carboxyl carrier protein [Miniphocaeibacter massiliensis]|uniref:acetyl-CoA carboxylase biotin carboxyl carrier protein n=1 Tax=Miniphocaeibacter massiliensis TaxID=2041841 RepID=UPI000C1BF719|nr:acetyl-CoA carboxylase biotin carboxyl carrier protein [Miniphocaeibacter massiliensis]